MAGDRCILAVVPSFSAVSSASVCWLVSCAASASTAVTSFATCEKGQHLVESVRLLMASVQLSPRYASHLALACAAHRGLEQEHGQTQRQMPLGASTHIKPKLLRIKHPLEHLPQPLILGRPWPQPLRNLMRCLRSGGSPARAAWMAPPPPWQPPRARVSPCGVSWPAKTRQM